MGRRTDLATLLAPGGANADAVVAPVPAAEPRHPVTVPLTDLAENPDNPRAELRDLDGLADTLRERGALQPLGVVPRKAFLAAHPQHTEAIGDAPYVVLHGHRRLAAAHLAGITELPVHVREDASRTDEDALIENVQRDDLTELEQAQAIQGLVLAYGYSQREVAARLGKSQGFVSQRLSLLKLREELRQALADGRLGVEDARRIARLPHERQELPPVVEKPEPAPVEPSVPEPRHKGREGRRPVGSDYGVITLDARGTPESMAEVLRHHLSPAALDHLARLLAT